MDRNGDRTFLGLPGNVFTLGWVSFFMDVSSEMIYPLMPLFLTNVLGVNKTVVGLIEGVAESTASLLKVVSGYISDRIRKRKALILFGYGFSTLTRPILAISTTWWGVLGYRFIDRVGKGIRTAPRDAVIAESTERGRLGMAFGFHRAMDTFGAIVGPAIAIVILYLHGLQYPSESISEDLATMDRAFRSIFWISMIPGVAAVLLIVFFVREKIHHSASRDSRYGEGRKDIVGTDFKKFLVVVSLFTLGNSSNAFIILKLKDVGTGTLGVIFSYLLFNGVYSLSSIPAGMAADYFGKKRMILIGYILFGLIYLGLAFSTTTMQVWILLLSFGVFMGISEGIQRAFVATLLSNDYVGTGYGLYHSLTGSIAFPSSLIAGMLWDMRGPEATFLFGTFMASVASILFMIFFWKRS